MLLSCALLLCLQIAFSQLCAQPNCLICDPQDEGTCFQCAAGYTLSPGYYCTQCSAGCLTCTSKGQCFTCSASYTLSGFSCIPCEPACYSCQAIDNTLLTNCTQCLSGFYAGEDVAGKQTLQVCLPCVSACISCSNNSSCNQCAYQFGYNPELNKCLPCGFLNCAECNQAFSCLACVPGFYLNSSDTQDPCYLCPSDCLQCSDADTCLTCSDGYFTSNGTCQQCVWPCAACINERICQNCQVTNYLKIINESSDGSTNLSAICVPCIENCVLCKNGQQCEACYPGNYLDADMQCVSCGKACERCSQGGFCLRCSGSYYLGADSICTLCPLQCSLCEMLGTGLICTQCANYSYTLADNQCVLCSQLIEGCKTCEGTQECLTCDIGYYPVKGACIRDKSGLATVYIVLISIAGVIGLAAIVFGVWACWRSRNGYGVMGEGSNAGGVRASYYEIP